MICVAVHRFVLLGAMALCLGVMVTWLPNAHAASRTDPVIKSINRAVLAGNLTRSEGVTHRTRWRSSARRARNAPTFRRRMEIIAVRNYTAGLARAGTLSPDRVEPALLSVHATAYIMGSTRRFPSHEAEITIPGEPIVFTYYAGRGVQFQPFESFKYGNRLIKQAQPDVEQARIVADRMLQLSRTRSLMTTWEYFFPFGGPARPWTSAISQANGINFYSRLGELLGPASGARYTAVATRMSRAFLRSSSKGGVVSAQGTGHFYVMYSFHPRQRILNGHLQALLDTYRLWERTGSATAKLAYDKGYAAIAPMLRRFDTGGWSNYQLGQEADLEYHEFMTKQLTDLAEMTGAPIFQTYAARFQSHLTTAPIVTFPNAGFPAIVAVRDGYRDTTTVGYRVNKRSRVTMLVRDADGHEVWRGTTRHGRGAGSLTWRGVTNAGARAPYGTYTARLTATDIAGNRRSIDTPSKLRILRDDTAPSPGLIAVKRHPRGALVTVRAFDGGSAWVDVLVRVGGKTVASRRGPRVGTSRIVVSKPLARVMRGSILLRDSSGNVTRVPLSN